MKLAVKSETTRHNISVMKKIFQRMAEIPGRAVLHSLVVFVNRSTGEMRPQDTPLDQKDWKSLVIFFHPDREDKEEPLFEVEDGNEKSPKCVISDLHAGAYKVMAETLKVLNILGYHLESHLDEKEVLFELDHLKLLLLTELRDIVFDAWYQVDREAAEKILLKHPVGTYFFRKDDYIAMQESNLKQKWGDELVCFNVIFLEEDHKVCERMIVKRRGRWLFYNDDPELDGHDYSTIYELLDTMGDRLKFPLLNE